MTPERFERQMEYLVANDYRVCSVSELVESRMGVRSQETERLVGLTFDDAFQELLANALPVLKRFGFGATIYVPTAYIGASSKWLESSREGDRRILDAQELRAIADDGIECGAHSHTHVALDVVSLEVARAEIELSKRILEETIGRKVRSFAYPFGYQNARVRALVAELGYASACRVHYQVSPMQEDVYALSRLPVDGSCPLDRFASLVEGHSSLRHRRVIANAWRPLRRSLASVH